MKSDLYFFGVFMFLAGATGVSVARHEFAEPLETALFATLFIAGVVSGVGVYVEFLRKVKP